MATAHAEARQDAGDDMRPSATGSVDPALIRRLTARVALGPGVREQVPVRIPFTGETYGGTWTATASPIGGMKQSGFGRRHGAEGILEYTEAQTIAVQRFLPLAPVPFLREEVYSRWMPRLVGLRRRIPGLR